MANPKRCLDCGDEHYEIGNVCRACQDEPDDPLTCGWEKQERIERQRELTDRSYFG